MNNLCHDCIALDTNVLIDMFNPQKNTNDHIVLLLERLVLDRIERLEDEQGEIADEYDLMVKPIVRNAPDDPRKAAVLDYWMQYAVSHPEDIDPNGHLMTAIARVIVERRERLDRIFVAVAYQAGRILVTNDAEHILIGPLRERRRRNPTRAQRLRRELRHHGRPGAELLPSVDAHGRL